MTVAAELIAEVCAAGGKMRLLDGQLKLKVTKPMPGSLVAALREHKREIVAVLGESEMRAKAGRRDIPWTSTDWHAHFHERVGIRIDGGLSEAEAQTGARDDLILEWLFQNPPEPNDGSVCGHCNGELGDAVALPYLAGRNGHIWLHQSCWPEWFEGRKQTAAKVLKELM